MLSKLLIEKTKHGCKTSRLWDGRGMYLEITPKGGKWWRFKYRFAGKERRMSLGEYSGEDDRRFRANVTGDSAGSALLWIFTLVGHDQSTFGYRGELFAPDRLGIFFVMPGQARSAASAAEAPCLRVAILCITCRLF